MLNVSVWDEINCEWSNLELDLPPDTKDPHLINKAIDKAIFDAPEHWEPSWSVEHHSLTGPVLTIVTRDDRNHLCIIVVNYEAQ
jgi:hypothetical protein